jgi:hypothetical protein
MNFHILEKIGAVLIVLISIAIIILKVTVGAAYILAPLLLPACAIFLIGYLRRNEKKKRNE